MMRKTIGFTGLVVTLLFGFAVAAGAEGLKTRAKRSADILAIEKQIYLYADALDWDRADAAAGKAQFLSIFTDDVVASYPKWGFGYVGKGDEPGGLGWFYTNFNMANQTLSHTIISNIIVTVNGKEATTKDRYIPHGVFPRTAAEPRKCGLCLGLSRGQMAQGQRDVVLLPVGDGYVQMDNVTDEP